MGTACELRWEVTVSFIDACLQKAEKASTSEHTLANRCESVQCPMCLPNITSHPPVRPFPKPVVCPGTTCAGSPGGSLGLPTARSQSIWRTARRARTPPRSSGRRRCSACGSPPPVAGRTTPQTRGQGYTGDRGSSIGCGQSSLAPVFLFLKLL